VRAAQPQVVSYDFQRQHPMTSNDNIQCQHPMSNFCKFSRSTHSAKSCCAPHESTLSDTNP
jgi:hypothetical protein